MQRIEINDIERLWALAELAAKQGRDVMAVCPAHDDKTPSLAITTGTDGRVLLDCKAGCKPEDICSALGVTLKDLFRDNGENQKSNSDAVYDYRDAVGELKYQVCRLPGKKFTQRRPGDNGDYIYSIKGVDRLLYRLPELLASDIKKGVFIPEGEKDVDRLRSLGLTAVCNSGGAKNWTKEINPPLKGRRVIILGDNDPAGSEHIKIVTKQLDGVASEIRSIIFEELQKGGDVSDWLNNGGTKEKLINLVNQTKPKPPNKELGYRVLSGVKKKEIEYVVPEIIPKRLITSLVSQEGAGKSVLASDFSARISTGTPFANSPDTPNPKGTVLIFNHEEDTESMLVPRLEANGADMSKIVEVQNIKYIDGDEVPFDIETDIPELDALLDKFPDTRLVIFDPITSFCTCNENSNREVRQALKPLVDFAQRRNVAILTISHLNKKVDLGMKNRTIGSRAWSALPRMVWGIQNQQEVDEDGNKHDTDIRYLLNIKTNCGPRPEGLTFSIGENAKVIWTDERVDMNIDNSCSVDAGKVEDAVVWLEQYLHNKDVASATIFEDGQQEGYSRNILFRAKDKIKVQAHKMGFQGQWFWRLPDDN